MREIRFRAWHKDCKVMEYDPLIKNGKYFEIIGNDIWGTSDDYILMQYTGIKDANGKEIYEGDIVVEGYKGKYGTYEIKWNKIGFNLGSEDGRDYEVIGNIYENSNLLESENDNGE